MVFERNDGDQIRRRQGDSRTGGLRHKTDVPARIRLRGGGRLDAKIRDVSWDGMYLRHAMLAEKGDVEVLHVGSPVVVSFAPDYANAPQEKVQLKAQIVRRLPHGIGVRFLDKTAEHKRALRILAMLAVLAREDSDAAAKQSQGSGSARRDSRLIMGACRKVIERRLPHMIWTLRTEVTQQLRMMGQGDTDGGRVNAKAQAQILEDKGLAIGRTIERRVMQAFAEVGGLDDTQEVVFTRAQREKIKAVAAGGEPGLVDNEVLDGTLAMNAACQRFEASLAGKSFDLNVRLANVVRRRVDNIENPLVPAVMCRMMWRSVSEYCDSRRVHGCLHKALLEHVAPLLSDLYDEIHRTLDQQEVPRAFEKSAR